MAPAQSRLTTPLITQHDIKWKRKASYKITDKNFVGAKSNAVTKRLKLSADDATQAAAAIKRRRQSSVKDTDDENSSNSTSSSPKAPNTILEAADRSDDVTVETLDSDEDGTKSKDSEEEDDLVVIRHVETAKEQCHESNKTSQENKAAAHLIFPLERLSKDWTSPIYAFFQPMPSIVNIGGRCAHEFTCTASSCKGHGKQSRIVRCYLDTSDRNSTGNLQKHARLCWGDENVHGADTCGNRDAVRDGLNTAKKLKNGSIMAAFKSTEKGKGTYSHRQHDKAQTRSVMINNHVT